MSQKFLKGCGRVSIQEVQEVQADVQVDARRTGGKRFRGGVDKSRKRKRAGGRAGGQLGPNRFSRTKAR